MIRVRYVVAEDLKDIIELMRPPLLELEKTNSYKQLMEDKLEHALVSMQLNISSPEKEFYALALEDTDTHKIVGLATMNSLAGHDFTFYTYKVTRIKKFSHDLAIFKELELLFLSNDYEGYSELYSFYLAPEYRGHHFGKALALARLLFIANAPERFASNIICPLRGLADSNNIPPFWDGLGMVFFNIPYTEAYSLNSLGKKQFIADLVPRHPIYTQLLSEETRAAIGKTHSDSQGTQLILETQGFSYKNHINIFDGGPILECPISNIKAIKNSRIVQVNTIVDTVENGQNYLVTTRFPFYALKTTIQLLSEETISISKETAELLNVEVGATVRILAFDY